MDIQSIPIWAFILVGFVAQMIDGALGMAYGVSSTTILAALGVPQKFASAAVHASEVVTTGISGLSHWRAGNVHFDLAQQLGVPGVVVGVVGAYLLSNFQGDIISQSITFVIALGSGEFLKYGTIILGLLIGGAIAAPLAALAARRLPHRPFMLLVGLLIVLLDVRTLVLVLS